MMAVRRGSLLGLISPGLRFPKVWPMEIWIHTNSHNKRKRLHNLHASYSPNPRKVQVISCSSRVCVIVQYDVNSNPNTASSGVSLSDGLY